MARYSGGGRSTSAGSATLPAISLYAGANYDLHVHEIGVWNTTSTAFNVAVRRLTSAGTQGAALDELPWDPDTPAATGTLVNTHTVGPTITAGFYAIGDIGASIGSGIIWTFGDNGLRIPKGTGNGIGILVPNGTGQVCDVYVVWDE
jgi:hypothetical protein